MFGTGGYEQCGIYERGNNDSRVHIFNFYPCPITSNVRKDIIDNIKTLNNELLPLRGDFIWDIGDRFLTETFYLYNGLNQSMINQLLIIEKEISYWVLETVLSREENWSKFLSVAHISYKRQDNKRASSFLEFIIDNKIIEGRYEKNPQTLDFLNSKRKSDIFANTFYHILDFQLFSCFSIELTKQRFCYVGVCETSNVVKDVDLINKNITTTCLGDVKAYLKSPVVKKNSTFCEYWYKRTPISPVQLLIDDRDKIISYYFTKFRVFKRQIKYELELDEERESEGEREDDDEGFGLDDMRVDDFDDSIEQEEEGGEKPDVIEYLDNFDDSIEQEQEEEGGEGEGEREQEQEEEGREGEQEQEEGEEEEGEIYYNIDRGSNLGQIKDAYYINPKTKNYYYSIQRYIPPKEKTELYSFKEAYKQKQAQKRRLIYTNL